MNKEQLEQIYYLKKELKTQQEILNQLQLDIALSPKALDGMPFANTNAISNPTESKAIKMAEMDVIIKGQIAKIQMAIREGEEFIKSLDDSEIRIILENRCILLKTWEQIGEILGYERTTVAKKYNTFWLMYSHISHNSRQ